jgi:hypothetical protein
MNTQGFPRFWATFTAVLENLVMCMEKNVCIKTATNHPILVTENLGATSICC